MITSTRSLKLLANLARAHDRFLVSRSAVKLLYSISHNDLSTMAETIASRYHAVPSHYREGLALTTVHLPEHFLYKDAQDATDVTYLGTQV